MNIQWWCYPNRRCLFQIGSGLNQSILATIGTGVAVSCRWSSLLEMECLGVLPKMAAAMLLLNHQQLKTLVLEGRILLVSQEGRTLMGLLETERLLLPGAQSRDRQPLEQPALA